MPDPVTIPLMRCPELVVRPMGENGQHVIKDPKTGNYFNFGEQEAFLLLNLDGQQTVEGLCTAFAARFGEPFSVADLRDFLEIVYAQGLLEPIGPTSATETRAEADRVGSAEARPASPAAAQLPPPPQPRQSQSILCWRKRIIDPDRFLGWLAPKLGFCFTTTFLGLSLAGMGAAAIVAWTNRQDLVSSFAQALRWETAVLVWVILIVVTACHEFAHGLTCKRFGGEVHEIGVLVLLFLPCLYCNVSDSWLFREKSKRLWVALAGGYWDLCLWALAVFVWRLTEVNSLPNYLAYVLLSVLGMRVFFNFNPLLRLDGYYFLSDLVGIPNLQPRALEYWKGQLRWLLWGAPRPASLSRGWFLLVYGASSWLFLLGYFVLMFVGVAPILGEKLGWFGTISTLILGVVIMRGFLQGLFGGELRKMLRGRPKRIALWAGGLATVVGVLFLARMEDRAGGSFRLRSVVRAEIRAPVAGFLRAVDVDEGSSVAVGAVVARLEVPNLASRITQKRAEVREADARLRLLTVGPRPQEVQAQRRRVERAQKWSEQAERHQTRARRVFSEELARLDRQIDQFQADLDFTAGVHTRSQTLRAKNAISDEQYRDAEKKWRTCRAQLAQAQSQRRAREITGLREEEVECARRRKELAEAQTTLSLLECGARPEELEAARALLARMKEELHSLEEQEQKLLVSSPVAGLITTPRLADKVGQYVREGELICLVEEPSVFEAEITLTDEEAAQVHVGQQVELKARSLPFHPLHARVERIAPCAVHGESHCTVAVYCKVEGAVEELRSGMIGHARITRGRRTVGTIWVDRLIRYLRTEFM